MTSGMDVTRVDPERPAGRPSPGSDDIGVASDPGDRRPTVGDRGSWFAFDTRVERVGAK